MNSHRNNYDGLVKRPDAALRCIPPRPSPGQANATYAKKYDSFLGICAPCLRPRVPFRVFYEAVGRLILYNYYELIGFHRKNEDSIK